jgi:selenide,water dikinase
VDDPYDFGQVAAANALSDVYAKGGRPLTAMNIVCFPVKKMDISVLRDILRGGLDKMREAGVLLIGGHSVDDPEPKYGLSVTGVIHPNRVVANNGGKPGDKLILTKPIGTGVMSTAIKSGEAGPDVVRKLTASMTTLNKAASEAMMAVGVHACTDITGFGLLGHACEMLEDTDVGLVIDSNTVPVFPEALKYVKAGFVPGGLYRNRDYRKGMVDMDADVPQHLADLLYDPQTSGGLLMAVSPRKANRLLDALHEAGVKSAVVIGQVVAETKHRITVR